MQAPLSAGAGLLVVAVLSVAVAVTVHRVAFYVAVVASWVVCMVVVADMAVAIFRAKAVAAHVASSVVPTVRRSPFGACTATSSLHRGRFVTPAFLKERERAAEKGRGKGKVCVHAHARASRWRGNCGPTNGEIEGKCEW